MEQHDRSAEARLVGDLAAATTLALAGFIGLLLFDDDVADLSAGIVVGFVLWSLAAAVIVRAALVRLW